MGRRGAAIFLVYADLADARYEEEFNAWYDTEHLPLLLDLPGFLDAGRYVAVKGGPKYLAVYELESVAAVQGAAFRNRPITPWERRVSPRAIGQNVARVLGTRIHPPGDDGDRAMAPALQIGRMSVAESVEAEWNAWYNGEFLPVFGDVPGVIAARRFRVVEGEVRYATVYELAHETVPEGPRWSALRDNLTPTSARMRAAMEMAAGSPGVYRRITPAG